MSDTKSCPMCAETILFDAKKCRYCGEILDQALKMKSEIVRISSSHEANPGIAALLSVFIPGAGQLYSGRVAAGIVWLFCVAFGYLCLIIPGLVLHVACIFEATNVPKA